MPAKRLRWGLCGGVVGLGVFGGGVCCCGCGVWGWGFVCGFVVRRVVDLGGSQDNRAGVGQTQEDVRHHHTRKRCNDCGLSDQRAPAAPRYEADLPGDSS